MNKDDEARKAIEQARDDTGNAPHPPAGPHAKEELTDKAKTPGSGALPEAQEKDVTPGSG